MTSHRSALAALGAAVVMAASPAVASNLTLTSKSLTVARACILTANSTTSVVGAETTVREGNPTNNYGTVTSTNVATQTNVNRRTYISFDLTKCNPAVAAGTTIKLATLRLFVTAIPAVCRTHDIFKATAAWTELGLTWNNQPFGTTLNNPVSASRTASLDVGASPCQNPTANQYVSGWNVTPDVQSFVSGTSTNYGWMIRDDVEASSTGRTATYTTAEANLVAQGPQLIVTY